MQRSTNRNLLNNLSSASDILNSRVWPNCPIFYVSYKRHVSWRELESVLPERSCCLSVSGSNLRARTHVGVHLFTFAIRNNSMLKFFSAPFAKFIILLLTCTCCPTRNLSFSARSRRLLLFNTFHIARISESVTCGSAMPVVEWTCHCNLWQTQGERRYIYTYFYRWNIPTSYREWFDDLDQRRSN